MSRHVIRLKEYIPEGGIFMLRETGKLPVLKEIVSQSVSLGAVKDEESGEELFQLLLKREELGSTGIIPHIAVPHCKSDAIQRDMLILVGISREGVQFDAMDGQPVHLVFTVITKKNLPTMHLGALAAISHLVSRYGISARLRDYLDTAALQKIVHTCEYEF